MHFGAKKEHYGHFLFFLVFLLAGLFLCLFTLRYIALQQVKAARDHTESVSLAYEISRTSDNATRMLRLYVVTGNKKFRNFYNEIIAIRNGTAPRPMKISQLYWDLVVDPNKRPQAYGKPESLRSLIVKHDFTMEELSILNSAQDKIHQLLSAEERALNAMEGKFEDPAGNYTIQAKPDPELAKKIMFGDEYLQLKADILLFVQQFYQQVSQRTQAREKEFNAQISKTINLAIVLALLMTGLMLMSLFRVLHSLSKANKDNQSLLLNIFPLSIARRLLNGEQHIVDEFSQASIMFADIINFTQLAKEMGPQKIVHILNELFRVFDVLTKEYRVEKIKTIGDNYMVVSGVPEANPDNAKNLANYALAMLEKLHLFNVANNLHLQVRVGMSTGNIIAGVIGHKKFAYDVWGNVVNLASRLEELSKPNTITISERMAIMLEDEFILEPAESIDIKGIGVQKIFLLVGKKP